MDIVASKAQIRKKCSGGGTENFYAPLPLKTRHSEIDKARNFLKDFADEPEQQAQKDAQQNHSGKGSVKPKVLPLYPHVAGQVAEPVEFIPEEPHEESYQHDPGADHQQNFSKRRHT